MRFDFSDEQKDFARTVDAWASRNFTTADLRQAWADGFDRRRTCWDSVSELGLAAVLAPESYGGLEGEFSDLTLPFERLGSVAVDEQVATTAGVVLPVLLRSGDRELQDRYVGGIASGDLLCTAALNGARYVADAARADLFLLERDRELVLFEAGDVRSAPVASQDPTRRLHRCEFEPGRSRVVTRDPELVRWAQAASATSTAMALNGLSSTMLDMSTEYVTGREQFGRVVGGFQAVKHMLANVVIALEASRSMGWFAMYALGRDDEDWSTAAAMAKSMATSANQLAANSALQSHGGIGFTREHDLHLFLHRSKAMRSIDGSVHALRKRTAHAVFAELSDPVPSPV